MRSPREEQASPIHLRIYVYNGDGPPDGVPTAISLCPRGWRDSGQMTDDTAEVTCVRCSDHIAALGVDWR